MNRRDRGEKLRRLLHGHLEHIGNALPFVAHFEGLAIVAFPLADFAGYVDIGEKMHLDFENAVSATCLTTPAFDIEGETSLLVSAHLGFRKFGKEIADEVEDARVGRGIGSRGASDR